MAIYPVQSNYIIDVDIITTTSFKAGMPLIRDDNGRAIPADSQQLTSKTIQQKLGKFLGFAASDHDTTGMTIIIPDTISSSWLDNNRNFQRFENSEVPHIRRAIKEHIDPNFNIDNPTDRSTVYKRGIGVYNQQGEIYITDQFNPVLHGDYGLDGLDIQTINPGDLLTIGGGINAGKLVKVNVNSIGPNVLVIGQVEKYISQTGLLHFRLVSYSLSFGTNNLTLFYDFSNSASYTSGTTVYDLSSNSKNGLIQNGPIYTNDGPASYLTFDKSDDVIETNTAASGFDIYNKSFTLVAVCRPSVIGGDNMIFGNTGGVGGQDMLHAGFRNNGIHFGFFGADSSLFYNAVPNQIYYIVWRWSVGPLSQIFVNGANTIVSYSQPAYLGLTNIGISRNFNAGSGSFGGRIYMTKIFNRALTDTEVTNMYNFEKSRFGL